tara:strand:- start:367 stop:519 length:153 start_codon:yes stop_codon:yes gene_type:complete
MNIDIRTDKSLYIEIGEHTYYIDDSTDEQIISKWKTKFNQRDEKEDRETT